ncbi:nodulation protein NfeD [bacterium]|nr:nodulation protein NfeD [bacterium]
MKCYSRWITVFFFGLIAIGQYLGGQLLGTETDRYVWALESNAAGANTSQSEGYVAVIDMDMMILPGTQSYLEHAISEAENGGAKLLVVKLNTPGGILQTTQRMIQAMFQSKVPIVVYISPTGGTATSAGVFLTMAAHVAVMAPGTSIGSAHPVSGDGKDIEGDMRKKVEEATTALVKSVTEQRGRNIEWVEKAVRESVSLTDREAVEQGVVDYVAADVRELIKKAAGREVVIEENTSRLEDYSDLPIRVIPIDFRDEVLNVLSNPNVAAILWLIATTGISIELYNPGLIFPGVFGVISLVLALAVSQIIPLSQGGLVLLVLGGLLITAEFFFASGILAAGGIISMMLGLLYLVDVTQAPGLVVSKSVVFPIGTVLGTYLFFVIRAAARSRKQEPLTGAEGLIGQIGEVRETASAHGKIFVNGELWNATTESGIIPAGESARIVGVMPGMKLKIKALTDE